MSLLVQNKAPPFTATAVMPDNGVDEGFSLREYRGRYVVLFFYPYDFSAVCPTEILAFDRRLDDFRQRRCDVIGISVDSHFFHLAWKRMSVDNGGIGPVRFPLVADLTKQIAREYGVLSDEGVAARATFLIDTEGIVRYQAVNDMRLGRNIEDVLRTVDALQHSERSGDFCPANWEKGEAAVKPSPAGIKKYLQDFALKL
jgi:peroxiredoxin (alkyl hydroperoxide reductase subunit C)